MGWESHPRGSVSRPTPAVLAVASNEEMGSQPSLNPLLAQRELHLGMQLLGVLGENSRCLRMKQDLSPVHVCSIRMSHVHCGRTLTRLAARA